jgi:hypothetical protein
MRDQTSGKTQFAPNWDFIEDTVKKALRNLVSRVDAA